MHDETTEPAPPKGLTDRAANYWIAVVAEFDLSASELEILHRICTLLTLADQLEAEMATTPLMQSGGPNGQVVNRRIEAHRQTVLAAERLMRSLKVVDEGSGNNGQFNSGSARSAALTRWHGKGT